MSSRIRFTSALQVFEAFLPAREDIVAAPADVPPLQFARSLVASSTPEDAISFCAYLLPRREAVWWSCQCVRALAPQLPTGSDIPLAAAEEWVREPEEERRQNALSAGLAADPQHAAAWTALAAGWSGGSLAPVGQEIVVPPPAHLTAKAVRTAVLIGLARGETQLRRSSLAACVDACVRFAEGGDARPRMPR
jgi:hypothetical protein